MFLIWLVVWFLATQLSPPDATALQVWHWFGAHEIVTILLIIFLG